jgi:hypothetical protein
VTCLVSTQALGAEGLYLTWGDCALQGAGQSREIFACDTEVGAHSLYCGLTLPVAVDSVLGVEIVVDIQHESETLPDWWRFDVNGCRIGSLTADDNFGSTTCQDFLLGQASGGVQSYTVGMPRGRPNQARMRIALGVPSNQPRSLNATDMYYAARIVLSNAGVLGSCTGCEGTACLVLNSILVRRPLRPEGVPSTDVLITAPGAGDANWAIWQQGASNCQAVPTRKMTWGAVKSLYR